MRVLRETTSDWQADFTVPNHVYFVSDNREKVFAYVRESGGEVFQFKKPYRFDTRRRKFVEIANTFGFTVEEDVPVTSGKTIKVLGSKGTEYTVTVEGRHVTCSCSGFKFRSKCRHADSITA